MTPNQAFRLGRSVYGLQFHLEVDVTMIETWLQEYPDDLGVDREASARRIGTDNQRFAAALRTAASQAMHRFLDASW